MPQKGAKDSKEIHLGKTVLRFLGLLAADFSAGKSLPEVPLDVQKQFNI